MVWAGQEPLEIGSLVCGTSMKIKETRIFSCPSDLSLQSYCPFQSFSFSVHCKLMEACEQKISRTAKARVMVFGSQIVFKV